MRASLAAYLNLLLIAEADGKVCDEESRLLTHYRESLRLTRQEVDEARSSRLLEPGDIEDSSGERRHVLSMMVRVAWVDGELDHGEDDLLREVAATLGVGELEYSELTVTARHEAARHQRLVRISLATGAMAGLLLLVIAIQTLLGDREDPSAPSDREHFQSLERSAAPAVLLLCVQFVMENADGTRKIRQGVGSGFVVSPAGHVLTAKHVVKPWLYTAELREKVDNGARVDLASVRLYAWPSGASIRNSEGALKAGTGWSSNAGTLRLVHAPPDTMEKQRLRKSNGQVYETSAAKKDSTDVALLEVQTTDPLHFIPLGSRQVRHEKLDQVMVLGFPGGVAVLENDIAVCSPTLGEVHRVEESIFVDATLMYGSSGGPLIGRDGRVSGIAVGALRDTSIVRCITIDEGLALIPETGAIDQAERWADAWPDAARALLDLALREPTSADVCDRANELGRRLGPASDASEPAPRGGG